MFYFSNHTILALALTFLIRIAAIILFYNVLLLISAFYINSIGSTIAISDGLLLCSLVPIKSSGLTQKEREEFSQLEAHRKIFLLIEEETWRQKNRAILSEIC